MTLLEVVQNLKKHSVPCSLEFVHSPRLDGTSFSIQVPYGSMVDAIGKYSSIYQFMPCGHDQTILVLMAPNKKYEPMIIGTCNPNIIETVARAYDVQTNTCY